MNASPKIHLVTAHSDSDVLHWLTNHTRDERFIDNIFAELCVRLQRAGIPVKRASLHILTHHPQWLGARMMWADGMREAAIERVDYDVRERSEYIDSPANEIHEGATEVRAKGLTDYVAWPLYHTLGKRHFVSLTKQLGRTVLLSRAFADFIESNFDLERVGEYPVRGFNDPIELFAYHG